MTEKNILTYIILFLLSITLFTGCTEKQGVKFVEKGFISGQIIIDEEMQFAGGSLTDLNTNKSIPISHRQLSTVSVNPAQLIIELKDKITLAQIKSEILAHKGNILNKIGPKTYKVELDSDGDKILADLKSHPLVAVAEYDYPLALQTVPHDPLFSQQWNLQMLDMEKVWDKSWGNKDIIVAVVDTGILPDHPDLKDNLSRGYDFVDEDHEPLDTSAYFSHGTHVAGIIGAIANNNTGIAGINWQIKIMPVRVIGAGEYGDYSSLIAGINWAVENGAQIINLSLAGAYYSETLRNAVKTAVEKGITVIAAAGNQGTSPVLYPAKYPEVISVGAVGPAKEISSYSNYGPDLDLVAPGGNSANLDYSYCSILSTSGYVENNRQIHQYIQAEGTSMAAPHVSGAAALLYSRGITDPSTIKMRLKETALDLGTPGRDDRYGAGLLNIKGLLNIEHDQPVKQLPPEQNRVELEDVKIILSRADKENTEIRDLIINPDQEGRFSMEIQEGEWTLIAWLDTDHSSHINQGDYYAEKKNINIKPGQNITGLELVLGKITAPS